MSQNSDSQGIKSLTHAQQQHLSKLLSVAAQAQQAVNDFVVYLREEHDAPAPEWELYDLRQGFTRVGAGKPNASKE